MTSSTLTEQKDDSDTPGLTWEKNGSVAPAVFSRTAGSFHVCLRIHQSGVFIGTDSVDVSSTSTTVIVSISVVDGLGSAAIVVFRPVGLSSR